MKAAALRYDKEKTGAPKVVAAGSGVAAQNIIKLAIEHGIPIYHDDSAATMLTKLELGQEIPPELYQIVVDIYVSLLDTANQKSMSNQNKTEISENLKTNGYRVKNNLSEAEVDMIQMANLSSARLESREVKFDIRLDRDNISLLDDETE